jgi:hypothetical protein
MKVNGGAVLSTERVQTSSQMEIATMAFIRKASLMGLEFILGQMAVSMMEIFQRD